jgi:uncharacterized beta-barrel protein YwiB (DUF1934 family)
MIRIHTVQNVEGQKQTLDMTSRAALEGDAADYTITYLDEDGDLRGSTTRLRVENGRCVTISRDGSFESHMVVEQNVRHMSQHNTPYGAFMLGVSALQVQSDMNPNGGTLRFRYCTDVDLVPLGEISFDISLTRLEQAGAPAFRQ